MNEPPTMAGVTASLESILITNELNKRQTRPPDYQAENRALLVLAQHMADSPRSTLQRLAEAALEICRAESAGDANPRGADDAEDLGEHEVAKAEGAVQLAAGLRTLRIMLGHGSNMVARNCGQCSAFSRRTRPHQDQRALDERRPDQEGRGGEGESKVDVVQKQERRERPQNVEGKQEGPNAQVEIA